MKRMTIALLALGLALAITPLASAQEDEGTPGGDFPGKGAMKAMKKFRAIRIAELQEALNLDEKTTIKLNDILKKNDDERDKLIQTVHASMRELKSLMADKKPEDAKLNAVLDKLAGMREKIHTLQTEQMKELRKVLTAEQQAKFVLHMARFKKHMREMIRKSWQHHEQSPGPGPGGSGMGPGPHSPGMGLGMGPGPDMPPPDDDEDL